MPLPLWGWSALPSCPRITRKGGYLSPVSSGMPCLSLAGPGGVTKRDMEAFAASLISNVWIDKGWFSGSVAFDPSDGSVLWDILQTLQVRAPLAAALVLVRVPCLLQACWVFPNKLGSHSITSQEH